VIVGKEPEFGISSEPLNFGRIFAGQLLQATDSIFKHGTHQ
jgi:hypothetical protein